MGVFFIPFWDLQEYWDRKLFIGNGERNTAMRKIRDMKKSSRILLATVVTILAVVVGMAVDVAFCRFDIHIGGAVGAVIMWLCILIAYY